jgi:hypothetical protein
MKPTNGVILLPSFPYSIQPWRSGRPIRRILTLDHRDFGVYRMARKGSFTIL